MNFEVIDVFNHVYPREYLELMPRPYPAPVNFALGLSKSFTDIEHRIKRLDRLGIDLQVLSLARPTIDDTQASSDLLLRLMRAANDGIAKIAEDHSDRFRAVGTISLTDIGSAVDELNRCIQNLGLLGVQILSNVKGKPVDSRELDAFYQRVCHYDIPVWIHPTDIRRIYDWVNEFNTNLVMGWGIDTSLAMFRIVRSAVFERHPSLKVISHHMGAMIPILAGRIQRMIMEDGKDGLPPEPLKKQPVDYLKMFYADTAEGSWMPALACAQAFFGSDHLLFASDYPYTGESEPGNIVRAVHQLAVPDEEKNQILSGNATRILRLDC